MDQKLEQETFNEEGLAYEQVGMELKTLGIKKEVNKKEEFQTLPKDLREGSSVSKHSFP